MTEEESYDLDNGWSDDVSWNKLLDGGKKIKDMERRSVVNSYFICLKFYVIHDVIGFPDSLIEDRLFLVSTTSRRSLFRQNV